MKCSSSSPTSSMLKRSVICGPNWWEGPQQRSVAQPAHTATLSNHPIHPFVAQIDIGKFGMIVAGFADLLGIKMGDMVTRMSQNHGRSHKLRHKILSRQTRGQLSKSVAMQNSLEDQAQQCHFKPVVSMDDMLPDDDSFGSR